MTDRPDDGALPLRIPLENAWQRHLWAVVLRLGIGAFLIWQASFLAVMGWGLVVYAAFAAWSMVRALRNTPGAFEISAQEVRLPLGLSTGTDVRLRWDEIRHAYLLRKAVPWAQAGPMLVIETTRGVHQFPRDWFAHDQDQKQLSACLSRVARRSA